MHEGIKGLQTKRMRGGKGGSSEPAEPIHCKNCGVNGCT